MQADAVNSEIVRALAASRTQHGVSLHDLAEHQPLLIVFLRHLGCPFSREALSTVSAKRTAIEANGTRLSFVHMGTDAQASLLFSRYGLGDVPRVSDPLAQLYRVFGLARGRLRQIMGFGVWRPGAAALAKGHAPGLPIGDTRQMPGVFLVFRGELLSAFRHERSSDVPDYVALSSCSIGRE